MSSGTLDGKRAPAAEDWHRFWSSSGEKGFSRPSWSKRRILAVLEPFSVAGGAALDAGSGSGFFSRYFCERGMDAVAVDYAEKALAMTREATRGQARVVQADLLKEPLEQKLGRTFSLIFSDGLLEHFTSGEQDAILRNWRSVLDEKGVVVTFVPNRWSPWELIRPFFMPGIEETPFVLRGLADLHERNGLTVVASGGVNVLPFGVSPDRSLGRIFGMLLYVVARKRSS